MVIVKSEFALALNQVASERGITAEEVLDSMRQAIIAALRKEYPEYNPDLDEDGNEIDNGVTVEVNDNTGETKILKDGKDITPPGFGRIAAQTARQVIIQKIREAEKKTVISHYEDLIGTLIRGRVIRRDMNNVYVDIGKTEAIMPKDQQIRSESYTINNRYIFYLKEISVNNAGYSRVIVSRTAPELITKLFEREVPEIANGTVEVKNSVREPGERAKIAVFSSQSGVDPVGACVGQKGVRVQTVTDELNGREKIDIIQWNADPKLFIQAALAPAEILKVDIDEENKRATVTVNEDQAPLAIGKNGVNVNLAVRLAGYDIDITQLETDKKEEVKEEEKSSTKEEKAEEAGEENSSKEV